MNKINIASEFVILSDIIPNAVYDIRYYSTYNFVGKRIVGYEEPVALLTKKAALHLKNVSDILNLKGYKLKIYDAYRPQQAVDYFVRWTKDEEDIKMKKDFYPELNKTELIEKGYILEKSSHSRGSSVDLTLVDIKTEEDIDMGGTFDYFGKLSHLKCDKITEEQYNNRKFLKDLMIENGFNSLDNEWWHFTLKDETFKNMYFNFSVNSSVIKRKE